MAWRRLARRAEAHARPGGNRRRIAHTRPGGEAASARWRGDKWRHARWWRGDGHRQGSASPREVRSEV
eukprot:5814622-Pyramimonas_sp.AAC.1